MGLIKTFFATTSAHGLGKTIDEDPIRRWIWIAVCLCCYILTLGFIAYIIKDLFNPTNIITKINSSVLNQDEG